MLPVVCHWPGTGPSEHETMTKSSTVRICLFGYGFARTVMLPCIRNVQGAEAVGIAGPNAGKARETARQFGMEHAGDDHRAVLESAKPDLVLVATPPHRHAGMTIDALNAGCHVVCEKPMALDARESRSMLDAARARPDLLCVIDHELRLLPTRVALRRLIREGRLGRILRAEYLLHSWSRRDQARQWTWWDDVVQGGGALGALGSHAVDALRWLLGDVVEVSGRLATFTAHRPDPVTVEPKPVTSDEAVSAWLGFAGGAEASVTISLVEADRRHEILVTGSEGCARLREQGDLEFSCAPGEWETVSISDQMPPSTRLDIPDTDWARAFLRLIHLVVRRIRTDRGDADTAPLPFGLDPADLQLAARFEDGHSTQVVLDAIRRSADQGCRISL